MTAEDCLGKPVENSAAALSYGFDNKSEQMNTNVIVFDLGKN